MNEELVEFAENNVVYAPSFIPDIIVSWPRNTDYPLWRQFIRTNRARFNEIIVVFTETHTGDDYREFVKAAMLPDYVHFVQSRMPTTDEDWRNVAIHQGLLHSYNAEWIWFTEQDFYVTKEDFWREVYMRGMQGFDLIGVAQEGRLHPCSIFTKRNVLNMTHKDFSAKPPEYDHFGRFQKDVEALGINRTYLADEATYGYKHYNGLSHNWRLVTEGQEPVYMPEEFYQYLIKCLTLPADLPMDTRFIITASNALKRVKKEF